MVSKSISSEFQLKEDGWYWQNEKCNIGELVCGFPSCHIEPDKVHHIPKTQPGCKFCVNCDGCQNCYYCVNCVGCFNCNVCFDCRELYNRSYAINNGNGDMRNIILHQMADQYFDMSKGCYIDKPEMILQNPTNDAVKSYYVQKALDDIVENQSGIMHIDKGHIWERLCSVKLECYIYKEVTSSDSTLILPLGDTGIDGIKLNEDGSVDLYQMKYYTKNVSINDIITTLCMWYALEEINPNKTFRMSIITNTSLAIPHANTINNLPKRMCDKMPQVLTHLAIETRIKEWIDKRLKPIESNISCIDPFGDDGVHSYMTSIIDSYHLDSPYPPQYAIDMYNESMKSIGRLELVDYANKQLRNIQLRKDVLLTKDQYGAVALVAEESNLPWKNIEAKHSLLVRGIDKWNYYRKILLGYRQMHLTIGGSRSNTALVIICILIFAIIMVTHRLSQYTTNV